jgi:hypothetical protein
MMIGLPVLATSVCVCSVEQVRTSHWESHRGYWVEVTQRSYLKFPGVHGRGFGSRCSSASSHAPSLRTARQHSGTAVRCYAKRILGLSEPPAAARCQLTCRACAHTRGRRCVKLSAVSVCVTYPEHVFLRACVTVGSAPASQHSAQSESVFPNDDGVDSARAHCCLRECSDVRRLGCMRCFRSCAQARSVTAPPCGRFTNSLVARVVIIRGFSRLMACR